MTPAQIQALAAKIAEELFTNSVGREAVRVRLIDGYRLEIGNLSHGEAIERIKKVLEEAKS